MEGSLLLQQLNGKGNRDMLHCGNLAYDCPPGIYLTRDVLTDPPTVISIVLLPTLCFQSTLGNSATYCISVNDIEPTSGWLGDRNRLSLDICFMHSFGKCTGKAREKLPSTCHQIHVKRNVLDALRTTYSNQQRRYFCRTMKANITTEVSQLLWNVARRRFSLHYLEFKTEDIDVTAGSTAYEVEYRKWLTDDVCPPSFTEVEKRSTAVDNFFTSTNLCWEYAVTGRCIKGASCMDIHGLLVKSLSKHRYVKMALKEISRNKDILASSVSDQFTTAYLKQDQTSEMFPIAPNFYPMPTYSGTNLSSVFPGGNNFIKPTSSFLDSPLRNTVMVNNSLLCVVVEGPDNVLRIVPYRAS